MLTGGKIKTSNKSYTSVPHDYCIYFDESSVEFDLREMNDDFAIPPAHTAFNFTNIDKIVDKLANSSIDVVGITSKCEETVSNLIRGE